MSHRTFYWISLFVGWFVVSFAIDSWREWVLVLIASILWVSAGYLDRKNDELKEF